MKSLQRIRSKRSRRSKVRRSRRSKVRRNKVRRSKRSRSKRSRRSKVRRSKRSRSKRNRRSKLYEITDLDKLAYRLNKFHGLNKEIFKFLPVTELRGFLNDEKYGDLYDKYLDKMDDFDRISFTCKKSLRETKKELRVLKKSLSIIHEYVNSGYKPKNYKKKYPFLKILKE
jgi:hypothetical protein